MQPTQLIFSEVKLEDKSTIFEFIDQRGNLRLLYEKTKKGKYTLVDVFMSDLDEYYLKGAKDTRYIRTMRSKFIYTNSNEFKINMKHIIGGRFVSTYFLNFENN
jgi:hypothetical protein